MKTNFFSYAIKLANFSKKWIKTSIRLELQLSN